MPTTWIWTTSVSTQQSAIDDRRSKQQAPALAPIAAAKSKANGVLSPASRKHPLHSLDINERVKAAHNARESTSDLDYAKRNHRDEIPLLRAWLRLLQPPKTWMEASHRTDCINLFRVNRTQMKNWKPSAKQRKFLDNSELSLLGMSPKKS